MKLFSYVENGLERVIDGFYKLWPQPFPGNERLKKCKIISHRGEYDNQSVFRVWQANVYIGHGYLSEFQNTPLELRHKH